MERANDAHSLAKVLASVFPDDLCAAELVRLDATEQWARFAELLGTRSDPADLHLFVPPGLSSGQLARYARVYAHNIWTGDVYEPPRVRAPVTVFATDENREAERWRRYGGHVDVRRIHARGKGSHGPHVRMMDPENLSLFLDEAIALTR